MRVNHDGRGVIGILAADQLVLKPRLYSTFLLWLLSELFETLPEVGDLDKPKLVFIFDEAHLLFDDAPAALVQRIEQVVRLIRSKGVGVYFCSQFPRRRAGQHPGPAGQPRAARAAGVHPARPEGGEDRRRNLRAEPEAGRGGGPLPAGYRRGAGVHAAGQRHPSPVQQTQIAPPRCRMGAITEAERAQVRAGSPVGSRYDTAVNRESAAELLAQRAAKVVEQPDAPRRVPVSRMSSRKAASASRSRMRSSAPSAARA